MTNNEITHRCSNNLEPAFEAQYHPGEGEHEIVMICTECSHAYRAVIDWTSMTAEVSHLGSSNEP